ncbi:hypothetical protein [Brachybacterium hainanense]|uniref:Uncharacterized protein n=1 Tax=Brachybacterium hainanense TaxID=1541174 RepID=A0ABV6RAK8_9MICO
MSSSAVGARLLAGAPARLVLAVAAGLLVCVGIVVVGVFWLPWLPSADAPGALVGMLALVVVVGAAIFLRWRLPVLAPAGAAAGRALASWAWRS